MRLTAVAAALATLLPTVAAAGEPITARDYDVEVPVTLLLGNHRIVGMAGAYTSIAEGSGSMDFNPASFGIRHPHSIDKWDWDWHLDWMILGLGGNDDLENNGANQVNTGQLGIFRFGFNVQIKEHGFGLGLTLHQYTIPNPDGPDKVQVQTG